LCRFFDLLIDTLEVANPTEAEITSAADMKLIGYRKRSSDT
jgi:hypothetical protein